MNLTIYEEVLSEILWVLTEGTRSLRNEKGSKKLLKICNNLDEMNIKNMIKMPLKIENQLLFDLINKLLLSS